MVAVLLSGTVIAGLFLDGWSHLHRQGGRLGSFFTPWHGMLYAGFTANAVWIIGRNRHLWRRDVAPNPALYRVGGISLRYPFAVLGLLCVGVGMLSDVAWHTALGEENDVARVIAPSHVILFLGALLLIAAPLRSAWHSSNHYPEQTDLITLLPAVLSLALVAAATSFLLQWSSPFMDWRGSTNPNLERLALSSRDGLQAAMAARVVLASAAMTTPLLFALRRWSLPFGTATILFTVVAGAMASLDSFHLVATVLAGAAGGAVTDIVIAVTAKARTGRVYAAAVACALTCWPVYFVVVATVYDAEWPVDFALGVSSLCALINLAIAFGLTLPDREASAT